MKRRSLALLAISLLGAAACGDAVDPGPGTCQLSAPGDPRELVPGEQVRLVVGAICNADGTPQLRFTSSDTAVARVDSLTGDVTALRQGDAVVTARIVGGPAASAALPLHVTDGCRTGVPSLTVTPMGFSLVPGSRVALTARYREGCGPVDTRMTFASRDTTIATVDSAGVVTGRAVGPTEIVVTPRANPAFGMPVRATVVTPGLPILGIAVSPTSLTLAPLDTARLSWNVDVAFGAPAEWKRVTFRSEDSCAVTVDSAGLVTAIAPLVTTRIVVAPAAFPNVTQLVQVNTGLPPRGPSLTLRELTTGTPPQPADLSALRGVATATVRIDRFSTAGGGRVELWIAGRLAVSAPFPRFTPGESFGTLSLTFDTASRDEAGQRRFANGSKQLELRLFGDAVPAVPGCAVTPVGLRGAATVPVTIANP